MQARKQAPQPTDCSLLAKLPAGLRVAGGPQQAHCAWQAMAQQMADRHRIAERPEGRRVVGKGPVENR